MCSFVKLMMMLLFDKICLPLLFLSAWTFGPTWIPDPCSATAFNSSTVDCTTGLLMLTVLQATSCVRLSGSTASLRLHAKMMAESYTQPLSWFCFAVELPGWVSSWLFCGYFSKNLFFFSVSYSTKMTGCEPPTFPPIWLQLQLKAHPTINGSLSNGASWKA